MTSKKSIHAIAEDISNMSSKYINSPLFSADVSALMKFCSPYLSTFAAATKLTASYAELSHSMISSINNINSPAMEARKILQANSEEASALMKYISQSAASQTLSSIKMVIPQYKFFSDSDLERMRISIQASLDISPEIRESIDSIYAHLNTTIVASGLHDQIIEMKGLANEIQFGDFASLYADNQEDIKDTQVLDEIQEGARVIAKSISNGKIDHSIFRSLLDHPNQYVRAFFSKLLITILIQLIGLGFTYCVSPACTGFFDTTTAAISRAMDNFCMIQARNQETPQQLVSVFSKLRYVNVSMLTLRSNRSRSAAAIYDMTYGSQVKIVKSHKEWVKVSLDLGDEIIEGWVQKKYLAKYDYWAIKLEWAYRNVARSSAP